MADLRETRLSLHVAAELLLAGPQYGAHGDIRLRATAGGFGTVVGEDVRVEGTRLVRGTTSYSLDGRTVDDVAAEAGIAHRNLDDVYSGGCGLGPDHLLQVNPDCAAEIAEAFRRGNDALVEHAAGREGVDLVLWPEHFDIGITVDEVNYGVSPGDAFLEVPYAYVGPWTPSEFTGSFWNAPFGSARPLSELDDLVAYFAQGAALTAR
jgi:hypothetical protein